MGLAQIKPELDTPPADLHAIRARVQAAGSSFYWAMRFLPQKKRDALFAIYAFCREVDDIADGDMPREEKIIALDRWRQNIADVYAGTSGDTITRALAPAISAFKLRKKDFIAVIEGMEMDARGPIVAPSLEELDLYCDRVASAVGRLCIHAFGEPTAAGERVAYHLGRALQLTNILRDIDEDAAIGRLYLPAEYLNAAEIPITTPVGVAADARLPSAVATVGAMAETAFAESEAALTLCDKDAVRPAVIMMRVYRQHLDRLRDNAWRPVPPLTGFARFRANAGKLWTAIHTGLF
jgi:presqualene diphosphate synthase